MGFVLILLSVVGAEAALINSAINTAAVKSTSVTLICTSNISTSDTLWLVNDACLVIGSNYATCPNTYYLFFDTFRGQAADGKSQFSLIEVTSISGQVSRNLNINPTQLTDGQVYVCAEIDSSSGNVLQYAIAQLVVLDSDPICNCSLSTTGKVLQNDTIICEGSVSYNGNLPPVMQWRNNVTGQNFSSPVTGSNGQLTSTLTVTATTDLNGTRISCVTYFTQPTVTKPSSATNAPSYSSTWTSPTLNVLKLYAPANITCQPWRSVYQPGDIINCSADAIPTASYHWTRLPNGTMTQGSVLNITNNMVGLNFTYMCTATNRVGETSLNISFSVNSAVAVYSWPWTQASIAIATFGCICMTLCLVTQVYERFKDAAGCLVQTSVFGAVGVFILSVGLFIGSAVCLAKYNNGTAEWGTDHLRYEYWAWLVGTLVIHVVLTVVAIAVFVVAIVSIKGDCGSVAFVFALVVVVVALLCCVTTTAWTVVVGEINNDVFLGNKWTWQVMLIVLCCAAAAAIPSFFLWKVQCRDRCNKVCTK